MNIQKEIAELKSAFSALGEEIKMRFNDEPAKFGELTLVDGTIIKYEGDAPAIGSALVVVTAEGEVPAPDGVHETDSGLLIQTEGGVITEIEEKEMQVEAGKKEEEKPAEFATLENFETYRASVEERMANLEKTLISMLGKVEETFAVLVALFKNHRAVIAKWNFINYFGSEFFCDSRNVPDNRLRIIGALFFNKLGEFWLSCLNRLFRGPTWFCKKSSEVKASSQRTRLCKFQSILLLFRFAAKSRRPRRSISFSPVELSLNNIYIAARRKRFFKDVSFNSVIRIGIYELL